MEHKFVLSAVKNNTEKKEIIQVLCAKLSYVSASIVNRYKNL